MTKEDINSILTLTTEQAQVAVEMFFRPGNLLRIQFISGQVTRGRVLGHSDVGLLLLQEDGEIVFDFWHTMDDVRQALEPNT